MGCCTSAPMPEAEGPAPVKAATTTTGARTVTVQSTKPVAPAPAAADAAAAKLLPSAGGLKGAQRWEVSPGVLGKGHFAVVKKCRDTITGQTYAVKVIDKKEMVKGASVVKQEIEILKAVGSHPNIVQLVDHFEDATKHYLVMELCMGGDLFSQIVEHGKYSEQEAVRCCRQLADALKHIHSRGIVHRDLKPENILLTFASPDSPLKLADFGLSKLIKGHLHPMRTVCGTWAYCVAQDTLLHTVDRAGQLQSLRADEVTRSTKLVDEHYKPVRVKAIHTTERSREQLWSVRDQQGNLLFRCTGDHKLSLLERPADVVDSDAFTRRVEVRCQEFALLSAHDQSRFLGYTASPLAHDPSVLSSTSLPLKHIGRTFPLSVVAPEADAPLERFVGIEVCSETHRFLLASDIVTSNCAPEVIQRKPYDNTVDNWTLGVLMYILLSGYHPFDVFGECPEPELLQKIMKNQYDFDDPVWEGISDSAKDLIRGLLVLDPTKRISLESFLASPWINEGKGASQVNNALVVERLSKFGVGRTKFRALVVAKLASNKFKASLSRSKTINNKSGIQVSVDGVPLLSNGEPDYLGLGSERGVPASSTRGRFNLDGLESVREGRSGSAALFPQSSPRTSEPSSSASGSGAARSVGISVNQIDGLGQTGRSDHAHSDVEDDAVAAGPAIHDQDDSPPRKTRAQQPRKKSTESDSRGQRASPEADE